MNFKPVFLGLGLAIAGLAIAPSNAHATELSFSTFSGDAPYNALTKRYAFTAEGRIGNNSGNGAWEAGIHGSNAHGGIQFGSSSRQATWQSGVAQVFSLSYSTATRQVTYRIGNVSQTYTVPVNNAGFNSLFLRTRSIADTSVQLSNLILNGRTLSQAIGSSGLSSNGSADVDYLRIHGVSGDFTLTGNATLNWGSRYHNANGSLNTSLLRDSHLAFQVKVVNAPAPVPEPMTLAGTALFAGGGIVLKRKSRKSTEA